MCFELFISHTHRAGFVGISNRISRILSDCIVSCAFVPRSSFLKSTSMMSRCYTQLQLNQLYVFISTVFVTVANVRTGTLNYVVLVQSNTIIGVMYIFFRFDVCVCPFLIVCQCESMPMHTIVPSLS